MSLATGSRLGPYEILAPLGAGGMGEVYRARDTRLGREAAVKVLPAELAQSRERLARLEQEARAASALNHPNIVTIYDVGSEGGTSYVGMELVAGATLRAILVEGPLPMRKSAPMASQIAHGLAAAHGAGIVHRDLKPENVMVTSDGRVKLLDFGLAKVDASRSEDDSRAATAAELTQPGTLLGTVGYMSPEQVRGAPLDSRTDIFSFGSVLYEMASGRRPFRAGTPAETMTSILKDDPEDVPASTPAALERIIRRCLEKAPEQRFQSARDLAFALESLPEGSTTGVAAITPAVAAPRRARASLARVAALAAAAFAAGLLVRPFLPGRAAPSFSRAVRVTAGPAREFGPAISPDGKWIAYLASLGGRTDVWVKFIAGGDAACLTRQVPGQVQGRGDVGGIEITPDGSATLVSLSPPGALPSAPESGTSSIPAPLGGVPRRFLQAGHAVRFSPDGKRIVYVRTGGTRGDALVVANADGGDPSEILKPRGGVHAHWPAWSSDGRFVYFNYGISPYNKEPTEIYRVPAAGGDPEPVVRTLRRAAFPVPLPGEEGLVYSSNPDSADSGLWWKPFGAGPARRLTVGVGSYVEPRLSADGRLLVATFVESLESLLSIPADGDAKPQAITNGYEGGLDPAVSPRGGEIAYSSARSGNRNLWLSAADGSSSRPLTSGAAIDERPAFSPEGARIAFVSDRDGRRGIWLVDAGGGAPRRLADAEVLQTPCWSPDGSEILFAAPAGDVPGIYRVRVADGRVTRLPTPGASSAPAWSPRGDRIAYLDPKGPAGTKIEVVDPAGHPIPLDLPDGGPSVSNGYLAWSPDGKRLAALGVPGLIEGSVWVIEPGAPQPVRRVLVLPSGPLGRGLAWTPDGRSLIIGSLETSSDIVLFNRDR